MLTIPVRFIFFSPVFPFIQSPNIFMLQQVYMSKQHVAFLEGQLFPANQRFLKTLNSSDLLESRPSKKVGTCNASIIARIMLFQSLMLFMFFLLRPVEIT